MQSYFAECRIARTRTKCSDVVILLHTVIYVFQGIAIDHYLPNTLCCALYQVNLDLQLMLQRERGRGVLVCDCKLSH